MYALLQIIWRSKLRLENLQKIIVATLTKLSTILVKAFDRNVLLLDLTNANIDNAVSQTFNDLTIDSQGPSGHINTGVGAIIELMTCYELVIIYQQVCLTLYIKQIAS